MENELDWALNNEHYNSIDAIQNSIDLLGKVTKTMQIIENQTIHTQHIRILKEK